MFNKPYPSQSVATADIVQEEGIIFEEMSSLQHALENTQLYTDMSTRCNFQILSNASTFIAIFTQREYADSGGKKGFISLIRKRVQIQSAVLTA